MIKKKFLPVIIITVMALVLIGIKLYPSLKNKWDEEKLVQDDKETASITNKETSIKGNDLHRNPYKEETFPFVLKEQEELAKKYPDHFQIVEKIYYSWDNVESIYGKFRFKMSEVDNIQIVEFYADYNRNWSYTHTKESQNGKVVADEIRLYKEGVSTAQKPKEKVYTVWEDKEEGDSVQDAIKRILDSEDWMFIYDNYSNWKIKEGEKFNLPAYFVEGNIPKSTSELFNGPFSMVIAKDTGVILDTKIYGKGKEAERNTTVEEIHINEGVPEGAFNIDLNGYQEVSVEDYFKDIVDSFEKKSGGIDGTKDKSKD